MTAKFLSRRAAYLAHQQRVIEMAKAANVARPDRSQVVYVDSLLGPTASSIATKFGATVVPNAPPGTDLNAFKQCSMRATAH